MRNDKKSKAMQNMSAIFTTNAKQKTSTKSDEPNARHIFVHTRKI